MANKYWVGGTGNWSDDDNHWATSSGGTPTDGNLPISSDTVIIDANSGFGSGGTITLDDNPEIDDFIANSGYAYTIDGTDADWYGFSIYGSLITESGLTFTYTWLDFYSSSSETITSNGCSLPDVYLDGNGTFTLQDDFSSWGGFGHYMGTFDANDYNITIGAYLGGAAGDSPSLFMGSGLWTITGNDDYYSKVFAITQLNGDTFTVYSETSTIKFTDNTSYDKSFYVYDSSGSAGKTFYNVWFDNTGTGDFLVYGSNTFNDFKVSSPPHNILFQSGYTTTVSTFTVSGSASNLVTINSFGVDNGQYSSDNQDSDISFVPLA